MLCQPPCQGTVSLWEGIWETFYLKRVGRQVRLLPVLAWVDTQDCGELFHGLTPGLGRTWTTGLLDSLPHSFGLFYPPAAQHSTFPRNYPLLRSPFPFSQLFSPRGHGWSSASPHQAQTCALALALRASCALLCWVEWGGKENGVG